MVGTELKFSDAGKFKQLAAFPLEQEPASAIVAVMTAEIAIAKTDGIQALIHPSKRGRRTGSVNFVDRTANVQTAVVGLAEPK